MASHGKENEINIKMTYTQISQNKKKSQSSESMIQRKLFINPLSSK